MCEAMPVGIARLLGRCCRHGDDGEECAQQGAEDRQGRDTPPAVSSEKTWISESFAIAQSDVYVAPVGVGKGPFKLDAAYKANARKVAYDRVWLAGNRLADLLNEALK
jgi:hypothetical protein